MRWLCLLGLTACAGVSFPGGTGFPAGANGTPPAAPEVDVAEVRLVDAPTNASLAAYFCAQYAPPLLCRVFGSVPRTEDMRFVFDVELEIENRNAIPLPVVSALFAFEAFPEADDAQNLGTACVSLCEDPEACDHDASACEIDDPEVRTAEDFARAAVGFLTSVARGERRFQDLRVRTVAAGDRVRMVVRLELDAAQMTRLMESVLADAIAQARQGREPTFEIPYRLEGSVFVRVEGFAKIGASFGPHDARFSLR